MKLLFLFPVLALVLCSPASAQDFAFDGFQPEDGFWWNPDEPGSGLTLDYQESIMSAARGILVVALYTYREDGTPVWTLASGSIDKETLVFDEALNEFAGGSCIECDPYVENHISEPPRRIRIEFVAPNLAYLTLDGSERVQIRTFTFGTVTFPLGDEGEFEKVRVPAMIGRWVFVEVITATTIAAVRFNGFGYVDPGGVYFDSPVIDIGDGKRRNYTYVCYGIDQGDDKRYPACTLSEHIFSEGPTEITRLFTAHPGDFGPHRISGYRGGPVPENERRGAEVVWAFRLPWLEADFDEDTKLNSPHTPEFRGD